MVIGNTDFIITGSNRKSKWFGLVMSLTTIYLICGCAVFFFYLYNIVKSNYVIVLIELFTQICSEI